MNQRQFDAARTPAQKSHIARYEVLYREGGVYVDFDTECLRPLDDVIPGLTGFAAAEDDDAVGIAILGAMPGDATLKCAIAAVGDVQVEVGAFAGQSTKVFLDAGVRVHAIDPWDNAARDRLHEGARDFDPEHRWHFDMAVVEQAFDELLSLYSG